MLAVERVLVSSGINVLDNKTELRKEMDRRKQRQQRRDDEQQRRLDRRSSFELRLEQQANKLDLVTAHLLADSNGNVVHTGS